MLSRQLLLSSIDQPLIDFAHPKNKIEKGTLHEVFSLLEDPPKTDANL